MWKVYDGRIVGLAHNNEPRTPDRSVVFMVPSTRPGVVQRPDPHVSNVRLSNPRAFSPDSRVTHIRNRTDFERMSIHLPCSFA